MSALGDYVHLQLGNYIKHGTTKGSAKDSYVSLKKYINTKIDTTKDNNITESTINELKFRLGNDLETQTKRGSAVQRKWESIKNQVVEELALLSEQVGFEKYNDNLNNNKFFSSVQSNITEEDYDRYIRIMKSINIILKRIQDNNNMATSQQLERILDLYNQLNFQRFGELESISSIDKIQELVDQNTYRRLSWHISGVFGEKMVYAIRDSAWNIGEKAINKTINSAIARERIAGEDSSEIIISKDLVGEYNVKDWVLKDDDTYHITRTQDKVDVEIIVNRKDVYASVKNKKDILHENPSLQSSLNIYYTLLYLNQFNNFSNHLLNMLAANGTNKERKEVKTNKDDAIDNLKKEINYEALVSGNPFKSNTKKPNIFITFDRKSGKVFVMEPYKILKEYSNYFVYNNEYYFNTFYKLLQRSNKKVEEGPSQRILNLLRCIRDINLKVSLKVNDISEREKIR